MDGGDGNSKPVSFDGSRGGLFVPRWAALATACLFAFVVALVAVLVFQFAPCGQQIAPIITDEADPTTARPKVYPYVRLPTSVAPVSYDVELRPDFSDFSFTGRVGVTVLATEGTDNVTLHANNVTVTGVWLRRTETEELRTEVDRVRTEEDKERQFLVLRPDYKLEAGRRYRVEVEYKGSLNDQLAGFYRSSYQDAGGEKR